MLFLFQAVAKLLSVAACYPLRSSRKNLFRTSGNRDGIHKDKCLAPSGESIKYMFSVGYRRTDICKYLELELMGLV